MAKKLAPSSGRNKAKSFGDRKPGEAFLIHLRPSELKDIIEGKLSSVTITAIQMINGQTIPVLADGWMADAEKQLPYEPSETSRAMLQACVGKYLWQRFAQTTSVKGRSLLGKLTKIERTAADLHEAIEIYDHGDVLVRDLLRRTKPPIDMDGAYGVITGLRASAHAVVADLRAESLTMDTTSLDGKVWDDFVAGTIAVFELQGHSATISKDSGATREEDHPSRYVHFVWSIIRAIPEQFREHYPNRNTLALALSRARSKAKKARTKRSSK
jgi:hypothetical protein